MAGTVRMEYYQTEHKIVITVFDKGIDESKVQVQCEPYHLKVIHGDKVLLNTSLYNEVVNGEVSYVVRPRKIEITLKKVEEGLWPFVENKEKDKAAMDSVPTDKWTQMIREVEKEEEDSGKVEDLFKKIFKDANDDTKRAMLKSFTESNGTVLSTDWSKIGKEKTEVKPPDGMEFKPY